MIKSGVECTMESVSQAFWGQAQATIIFDGFDGWKFASANPIYQFPRAMTFVGNFLDFCVEESSLDVLNYLFEVLPIIETSCCSIVIERMAAFISPPLLGMFGKS